MYSHTYNQDQCVLKLLGIAFLENTPGIATYTCTKSSARPSWATQGGISAYEDINKTNSRVRLHYMHSQQTIQNITMPLHFHSSGVVVPLLNALKESLVGEHFGVQRSTLLYLTRRWVEYDSNIYLCVSVHADIDLL